MVQVVKSVAASTDDAYDTSGGSYSDSSTIFYTGIPFSESATAGLRFLALNIPAGATITGVSLQLEDPTFEGGTTVSDIAFEDSATPATFSAGDSPADRTMTTAKATAVSIGEPAGVPPQLQTIAEQGMIDSLQELVDTYGAIENVVLLLADNGSTTYNPWTSFDGDGTAPQLTVDYTGGGGGEETVRVRRDFALMGVGR